MYNVNYPETLNLFLSNVLEFLVISKGIFSSNWRLKSFLPNLLQSNYIFINLSSFPKTYNAIKLLRQFSTIKAKISNYVSYVMF